MPGLITPAVSLAGGHRGQAAQAQQVQHVYHQYTVRVQAPVHQNPGSLTPEQYLLNSNRDNLVTRLSQQGVGTMCYYPVPLHLQKAFAYLGYKLGDFPISEHLSREVLSLPMYPELTEEDISYVSDCVAQAMASIVVDTTSVVVPGVGMPMGQAAPTGVAH